MRPRSDKGGGHFPSMPCASLAPAPLAASLARVVGVVVPDATEQADLLPPDAENRQQWQIRDVPRAAAMSVCLLGAVGLLGAATAWITRQRPAR